MILDLREFEEFPAHKTIEAGPGALKPFADTVVSVERVSVDVDVQKAGDEYFCQAAAKIGIVAECARCLTHFPTVLKGRTDFIICSDSEGNRLRVTEDSEDYVFLKGTDLRVDITEPVRQTAVLSMPLKPLCSEDCKGLCPRCGTNLNEQTCDCVEESIDPRWEGLKDLTSE